MMVKTKDPSAFRRRFSVLLVIGTVLVVTILPFDRRAELADLDRRFSLVGGDEPTGDVVLVTIDDASFREIGLRWPWPRTLFADAIRELSRYGVKAIGIDIAMSEAGFDPKNDRELAAAIADGPPVVVPTKFERETGGSFESVRLVTPIDEIRAAGVSEGYVNLVEDPDGRVRRYVMYQEHGGTVHLPFSVAVFSAGKGIAVDEIGSFITPSYGRTVVVPFIGPAGTMPRVSFHEILSQSIAPEDLAGKYVLIGATFREAHDNAPTPFFAGTPMTGLEIHGQILDGILAGRSLSAAPVWVNILVLVLATGIAAFVFQRIPPLWGGIATFTIVGIVWSTGVVAFKNGVILAVVPPIAGAIIVFIGMIGFHYTVEARRSRYVRSVFSRYVAPSVVGQILENPDAIRLGGELREVTLFFSDIRGFTKLSESKDPGEIVRLLNEYFDEMTGVIFEHQGTVNKFIGDAIMAFWGAPLPLPNGPDRAVAACIEMRHRLAQLNNEWAQNDQDTLRIGMAVHTGSVLVGNIGSTRQMEYTVIGDAVNVCSRIESMTKEIGTDLLISDSVFQRLSSQPSVTTHHGVPIRGRDQTITLHAVD